MKRCRGLSTVRYDPRKDQRKLAVYSVNSCSRLTFPDGVTTAAQLFLDDGSWSEIALASRNERSAVLNALIDTSTPFDTRSETLVEQLNAAAQKPPVQGPIRYVPLGGKMLEWSFSVEKCLCPSAYVTRQTEPRNVHDALCHLLDT